MQPDETQPELDFTLAVSSWKDYGLCALAPDGSMKRDEEQLAQGLCGLAFWAGQLQGENEKLRQEALAAPRSDAEPMGGAAQALLSHELQEATTALWAAREETDELRSRLRAHAEPSEELTVAREKAASFHAQLQELVERNTALEQEVCDLKCEKDALMHEGMELAKRLQDAVEEPDDTPEPSQEAIRDHIQDHIELGHGLTGTFRDHRLEVAEREAERWRLAAEALQRNLQAREEEWARRGMELLRHQALVESFARELGEAMLKRALEVRT